MNNRPRKFEVWHGGDLLGELDLAPEQCYTSPEEIRQKAGELFREKRPETYRGFEFSGMLPLVIDALRIDEAQMLFGADRKSFVWLTFTNLVAAMKGDLT